MATAMAAPNTCYCWRPYYCAHRWCAPVSPMLFWGTQQMITAPTDAALTAKPTERLLQLAQPKKDLNYAMEEPIMMCYDFCEPVVPVEYAALVARRSSRIIELAEPKPFHPDFVEQRPQHVFGIGRPSTITRIGRATRTLRAPSDRIVRLAACRSVPAGWLTPRPVPCETPPVTLRAVASDHVEQLSQPRTRDHKPPARVFYTGAIGRPSTIWKVREATRTAVASERTVELSSAVPLPREYVLPRAPQWEVPQAALNNVPTDRVRTLATPCTRAKMDDIQLDTEAYVVKRRSLKAVASTRVLELAKPTERDH